LIRETSEDIINGTSPEKAATRFHNSMARLIADIVVTLVQKTGIKTVGLTGGCFQNRLLTERTLETLDSQGLEVLLHESVPPNDGGLALGQAVTARERYLKSHRTRG
jgi:hydrogenase maturation protein HypF